jgi:hypothetical protein
MLIKLAEAANPRQGPTARVWSPPTVGQTVGHTPVLSPQVLTKAENQLAACV